MAHNGCCHLTDLVFSIFVNTFDLITDWSFYYGEVSTEDGLVFGPYKPYIVTTTLVFCVIATVTFVLEVILDFLKYYKKSDTVELAVEILAVTTLLIEDLPLIGINLHIALCREEATNVIQIAKASTAIFEVLVKLFIMVIQLCRNKCKLTKTERARKMRKTLKISIAFLLAINLILSIIVFSITINFQKSHIKFDSPNLDREVSNRYLQGVGVFMRLPNTPNMAESQWMMLTDLKNITLLSSPTYGMFLSVLFTKAPFNYIQVRKHFPGPPEFISCYKRQSTSMILLPLNKCSNITSSANTTTVSMRFTYIRPNNFQPMGDIHYNTELRQEFNRILTNETVLLKYFKVRPKVKGDLALTTTDKGGQYRFYNEDSDLLSTHEVWKTGSSNCGNNGRESPKLDTDLFVRCVF